jgi:hypothetical protein
MTKKCIYCYNLLTGSDESHTATLEHVVPYAVGGSDDFTTDDASKKYNNDLGSSVDAPFSNLLPIAILRHQLGIKAQSGKIPAIELNGRSTDNGEPYRVIIEVDGNVSYTPQTVVITDTFPHHSEKLIGGDPVRVAQILEGMLRKAEMQDQVLYDLKGGQIRGTADISRTATIEETSKIKISFNPFDLEIWSRGIAKIILGAGHIFLGPDWTFSSDGGDRFRTILFAHREQWPDSSIEGFFGGRLNDDVRQKLEIGEEVQKRNLHTIAVLPREVGDRIEYCGVVSIFGGAIPEVLVSLGSEQGHLPICDGGLPPHAKMGARIDPQTRKVIWLTAKDILRNT